MLCGLGLESPASPSCHPAALRAEPEQRATKPLGSQEKQGLLPHLYSTNNRYLPLISQNHPAPVPSYQHCGAPITPQSTVITPVTWCEVVPLSLPDLFCLSPLFLDPILGKGWNLSCAQLGQLLTTQGKGLLSLSHCICRLLM